MFSGASRFPFPVSRFPFPADGSLGETVRATGSNSAGVCVALLVLVGLCSSCIHKKYDNPITKDTQQPDKILFDTAMKDIEHGRYEIARLSLQTLMNTYESSEYLAKAKLAIADSWYREGGTNGLAQAEAEYKDFILFYPNMPESAESQSKVCEIHYKQMDKADRDITQALRAEDECRQLMIQFPNSRFAPQAAQRLRDIQEVLAAHEFGVGDFYWRHEMMPAAANRLNALADQWPLFSQADEALYAAGDAYAQMGPRFRKKSFEMWDRVVRDYPLSARANEAKKRLQEAEQPVPEADPGALARMKYDQENRPSRGMMAKGMGWMRSSPDVTHAARSGAPTMTDPKKTIPASVPVPSGNDTGSGNGAAGGVSTEVTASTTGDTNALDQKPDARNTAATGGTAAAGDPAPAATTATGPGPLPTNRDKEVQKYQKQMAKKKAKMEKKAAGKNKNGDAASPDKAAGQQTATPAPAKSPNGAPENSATPAAAASGTTSPQ